MVILSISEKLNASLCQYGDRIVYSSKKEVYFGEEVIHIEFDLVDAQIGKNVLMLGSEDARRFTGYFVSSTGLEKIDLDHDVFYINDYRINDKDHLLTSSAITFENGQVCFNVHEYCIQTKQLRHLDSAFTHGFLVSAENYFIGRHLKNWTIVGFDRDLQLIWELPPEVYSTFPSVSLQSLGKEPTKHHSAINFTLIDGIVYYVQDKHHLVAIHPQSGELIQCFTQLSEPVYLHPGEAPYPRKYLDLSQATYDAVHDSFFGVNSEFLYEIDRSSFADTVRPLPSIWSSPELTTDHDILVLDQDRIVLHSLTGAEVAILDYRTLDVIDHIKLDDRQLACNRIIHIDGVLYALYRPYSHDMKGCVLFTIEI